MDKRTFIVLLISCIILPLIGMAVVVAEYAYTSGLIEGAKLVNP